MLVSSQNRNSVLYDTLCEMGLLCSEEKHIRMVREESESDTFFTELPLSISDVDRVGYSHPHFSTKSGRKGYLEVWVDGMYEHPSQITWVDDNYELHGILSRAYDVDTQKARVFYNPGIIYRYSNLATGTSEHSHTVVIDTRLEPYNRLDYPDRCAYYITQNQVKIPTASWLDDSRIQFTAPYTEDIDFFICSDIVGVFIATKNVGLYIDSPNDPICYHHIVVDDDPSYHIDARFYPCIKVDKDCVIRVFNDHAHRILYPEVSRLVLYPEFADVIDPYNTKIEYLRTLSPVDDVIRKGDTESTIHTKFRRIARFCYRLWERFPWFSNEQSDFVICDNNTFGKTCFSRGRISGFEKSISAIYTEVPFEAHRDILFYDGMMFSDYRVMTLSITPDGRIAESPLTGLPRYVIPEEYDVDKFALIKFNVWEDTQIINVGDYIDEKLTINLHEKLNRFYRNLMVVRTELLTQADDEYVRVMTAQPPTRDDYLWFELLINVTPEEFENNPDITIKLFGLDPVSVPRTIMKGAYRLDLDPKDGPVNYTELLMTYYELTAGEKQYLALHYENTGETSDPTTKVFHDIMLANQKDIPTDRLGLVIEDPAMDAPYIETAVEAGTDEAPAGTNPVQGDLYAHLSNADIDMLLSAEDTDPPAVSYMNEDTGSHITVEEIAKMAREEKLALIQSKLDDEIISAQLDTADDGTLNKIVYDTLKAEYVHSIASENPQANTLALGTSDIIQHNLTYILSEAEPTDANINDLWIQVDDIKISQYIGSIVSYELKEGTQSQQKNPHYDGHKASMILDYGPNADYSDGVELFKPVVDPTLRPLHYGKDVPTPITDMDVWYEYLDEVNDKICYYDADTIVIRVDERLVAIRMSDDNLQAFLFDDVMLNFRGKLGMKYLSILADLVNSNVIDKSQVTTFYKRLITSGDDANPKLTRLYTGTSHIVSITKADTTDLSVLYSTNIGRFTMTYTDPDTTNREREAAYRMCIDYSNRDFAYLAGRMLVFINGKYIPQKDCKEGFASKLQILNFDEIINTVDILYSKRDEGLMKLKKASFIYWNTPDTTASIQRPERDYGKMEPIELHDETLRGYYDILLDEYIFNGKLLRILGYLEEHPDEVEVFKRDIIQQFHAISDLDLSMMTEDDNARIIIPAIGTEPVYTIEP